VVIAVNGNYQLSVIGYQFSVKNSPCGGRVAHSLETCFALLSLQVAISGFHEAERPSIVAYFAKMNILDQWKSISKKPKNVGFFI